MILKPIQNTGIPAASQESAAQVTDGTSNTIMVAESAKAQDVQPDFDQKSRLAENKMQADARAADLNAQLDQKGEQKPKENNIIAILIG